MKLVFSALVTLILLFIYVYLVWFGLDVISCVSKEDCPGSASDLFNDRMASSLALIGGLVSALVIAELAVTSPGEFPAARMISPEIAEKRKGIMQMVTGLYLTVWLTAGLLAFFYGYLLADPNVLPPLADLGQNWLGIAVGAGYAYFGIKQ